MKIEHVALQVPQPAAMADWYVEHLDFQIRRSADGPVTCRFLADSSGSVMLEVYYNPKAPLPDYPTIDPLVLHVAFVCDDVPGTVARLVTAGATLVSGPEKIAGDQIAMLRDPWGLPIQFIRRGQPMI